MKEANTNEVVDTISEMGSAESDKIAVEKDKEMIEPDQAKSQLDNSMQCEAVRVDDAIEETKSIDRKCVEEIKSNVKKSSRSKVEGNDKDIVGINKFSGNAKNNSKFYEATNENSKMPCRNKSKQENDVEDKNSKMPNLKKKANSDTDGDSKLATKPRISLKPVSKLKESSCFGSFLEKIEKTARKRKIGSLEDYKSKRKFMFWQYFGEDREEGKEKKDR